MADTIDRIAQAQDFLKAGKVQEAADLLLVYQHELEDAAAAAAGQPKPPRAPRAPLVVLTDMLRALVAHLGNRPEHVELLDELEKSAGRKPE